MDFSALDRHAGRIALSFSGGKDSMACIYLLRDRLPELTVYHLDTGDLLPEVMEVVDHVRAMAPNFVTVRTDVKAWHAENGFPSDLVPHSSHWVGQVMGEGRGRLVPRYNCCFANLMSPLYDRVNADGKTLLIRGTKAVDMKKLPIASGEISAEGVEILYPLQDWTTEQVFSYLRSVGAPISKVYDHFTNSPECATCPAWWGERRAAYLRERHPILFQQYMANLAVVIDEIAPIAATLSQEVKDAQA